MRERELQTAGAVTVTAFTDNAKKVHDTVINSLSADVDCLIEHGLTSPPT